MATDPMFDMFHKYNRLVRRNLVKPLTCPSCGTAYVTGLGPEDELVLLCVVCDTKTSPGEDTIGRVRAVVSEHFK